MQLFEIWSHMLVLVLFIRKFAMPIEFWRLNYVSQSRENISKLHLYYMKTDPGSMSPRDDYFAKRKIILEMREYFQ